MAANQFELAEAFTTLSVDDARMKMQLKNAKTQVIDLDATMQAASRTAAIFLTGGVAAIGVMVKEAADLEEQMSMFNVVFKENAEAVSEWADEFGDATGRSANKLKGFAATFQDTFVPLGFARDQAAGLSEDMTELAVDLASFKNIRTDEAVRALTGALIGNHENARQFGVIINESTLKAELMAMGMDDLTGKALEMAKVQARMNIIMRDTTDAQGDAARTSDSAANQMRSLADQFADARAEMGKQFLPVAMEIVQWATELLKKFNSLTAEQKKQIADWIKFALKLAAVVVVFNKMRKAVIAGRSAMLLLNAAMKANPAIAVTAGVVALTTAVWKYVSSQNAAEEATKKANEEQKKAKELADERAAAEKRHAEQLKKTADAQAAAVSKTAEANKLLEEAAKFDEDKKKKDKSPEELNQIKRLEGIKKAQEAIIETEKAIEKLREQQKNTGAGNVLESQTDIARAAAREQAAKINARKQALPDQIKLAEEEVAKAKARLATAPGAVALGSFSPEGAQRTADIISGSDLKSAKASLAKLKAEEEGLKHEEEKLKISKQELDNAKAALKNNREAIKGREEDLKKLKAGLAEAQKAAAEEAQRAAAEAKAKADSEINKQLQQERDAQIEPFIEAIKQAGQVQTVGITGLQGQLQSQADQQAKKAEDQRQKQIRLLAQIDEGVKGLSEAELPGFFAP